MLRDEQDIISGLYLQSGHPARAAGVTLSQKLASNLAQERSNRAANVYASGPAFFFFTFVVASYWFNRKSLFLKFLLKF